MSDVAFCIKYLQADYAVALINRGKYTHQHVIYSKSLLVYHAAIDNSNFMHILN